MLYQPAPGGRFTATNTSLRLLIQYAYDVNRLQIAGGPAWGATGRYDVAAKGTGKQSTPRFAAWWKASPGSISRRVSLGDKRHDLTRLSSAIAANCEYPNQATV